jgi:hypothetical protein
VLIVGEAPTMRNSSPSKLTLWMEYSFADLDKHYDDQFTFVALTNVLLNARHT